MQRTDLLTNDANTFPANDVNPPAQQETDTEGTSHEKRFSLVLNYRNNNDENQEKSEKSSTKNMLIVLNSVIDAILNDNCSDEGSKAIQRDLGIKPQLISNTESTTIGVVETFVELIKLHTDIQKKRDTLISTNETLREKVQALRDAKKVSVNEEIFNSNEQSINRYVKLIEGLISEVQDELDIFAAMARCQSVYFVPRDENNPEQNPLKMLELRIKNAKHYVKNIRRDINVSFSRYQFGLNNQMDQISYVERAAQRG